ncbi:transient receptor potential cation channel subfamily A member 1 homolog [Dreissena polymorpha]|uniref:transient receptor potential cation channel subfamily A member 1 homolog n=1 Tax=Dreissena polymorpha TaxID=45954 RepID=UPI0022645A74|nr:transient receptor potential cation channel subfamily A member 1 homolog [Dreissena polymorpha]
MFQAYLRRLLYLNWENLLEVCISISSFLYVLDVQPCQNDTGYRYDWQWNLGAIAIVTAWLGLVMFIQKFAYIGIYVVMFTSILQTFFRFFIVFLLFIIAFGLGFYALIQNQTPYHTSYHAIIRTMVMMIGEMDYNDIFHSDDKVHYWITYVLICIFLIVMSIIIMNLLVGLAVDDIKGVQEQASLKRLAMKTDLVLDVERLSLPFTSRWWRRELTMYSSNMEEVIAATKHPEEFGNQIQKSQRKTIKKIEKLKSNMKTLNDRTIKIEQMLNALLHASNIQLNAVDTVTINEDGWVKRRENDEN